MPTYANLCITPNLQTLENVMRSRLKLGVNNFNGIFFKIRINNIRLNPDSNGFHRVNISGYIPKSNQEDKDSEIPVLFNMHKNLIPKIESCFNQTPYDQLKDFDLLVDGKFHTFQNKLYFTITSIELPIKTTDKVGVIANFNSHGFLDFFKFFKATKLTTQFELRDVFIENLEQILEAIDFFDKQGFKKLVIVRGGGSHEKLDIFNDQKIFDKLLILDKKIDIHVAVGHYGDRFKLGDRLTKTYDTPSELGRALKAELLSQNILYKITLEKANKLIEDY